MKYIYRHRTMKQWKQWMKFHFISQQEGSSLWFESSVDIIYVLVSELFCYVFICRDRPVSVCTPVCTSGTWFPMVWWAGSSFIQISQQMHNKGHVLFISPTQLNPTENNAASVCRHSYHGFVICVCIWTVYVCVCATKLVGGHQAWNSAVKSKHSQTACVAARTQVLSSAAPPMWAARQFLITRLLSWLPGMGDVMCMCLCHMQK